jgi:predicted nuclease of predicted toxin-antitoxin system
VTFFLDNHVSHRLAQMLREQGVDAIHLRQNFPRGAEDIEWIQEAGRQGWIVITADLNTRSRKEERLALKKERVIGFFLAEGFTNKHRHVQWRWLSAQWQKIEQQAATAKPGECFQVPEKGNLKPYPVDQEGD